MGRNAPSGGAGWTELFFLDEVTALAAGHRPCFYCRRERAGEFARCFAAGQGRMTISAPEMDAVLHRERRPSGGTKNQAVDLATLPAGAMVATGSAALALSDRGWLSWSFSGWRPAATPQGDIELLTPPSTIGALRHGYRPAWQAEAAMTP